MRMCSVLALPIALLLTAAAPAQTPQEAAAQVQAQFDALDRDADNRISKTEAERDEALAQRFESLDTDGDGYVTADEFGLEAASE